MRIVIVSHSDPLEQMISYIVERGVDIEVVGEVDDVSEAGQIVSQEHPEWLFLLAESHTDMVDQFNEMRAGYTGLNIAAFNEAGKVVYILKGASPGTDRPTMSQEWEQMPMSDFVAQLTEEPAIPEETPRLTDHEEHRA